MSISLVQSASATASSDTSITITLGSVTTAGNCLVVGIGAFDNNTNPQVTGITLGGSSDHWASANTAYNDSYINAAIWVDPNCAGGQTSIVVTLTHGAGGAPALAAWAMEWSGVATSSPVDRAPAGANGQSTSWSSGSTGTLSQASEVGIGVIFTSSSTLNTPGSPWTELSALTISGSKFGTGYQVVSSTSALTYSGNTSLTNALYGTCIVTLKAAAISAVSPFTSPNKGKGASRAVRGTGRGQTGAKYVSFPSAFQLPRHPAKGAQAATRGRGEGIAGKYTAPPPIVVSPFYPPTRPAKGQTARRGSSIAHSGAPYVAFPSPFTPPRGPARGAQAAARGRSASSPGARWVLVRISPFPQPPGPARGASAVPRTGRSHSSPGARFVLIETSPFILPRKPSRGATAARRGIWSAGSATGKGAPFVPRTLIISIASAAGKDDYGNPFVQGIQVNKGLIQGQVIAAESIVKGILAPGAVDEFTLNAVTVNSGTVSASDVIISGTAGGAFAYSSGGTIVQILTGTGSWKVPAGVTSYKLEGWAAGGGGGGTNGNLDPGGGGGGGEYIRYNSLSCTPGTTIDYAAGTAGAGGGTSSNGGNGGDSVWDTTGANRTAHGGKGGHSASSFGLGGQGGTGNTDADAHFDGGYGSTGGTTGNLGAGGGSGGTSSPGNFGNTNGTGAAAVVGGGPGGSYDNPPPAGPGGGGGGYGTSGGADGWAGQFQITYTSTSPQLIGSIAGAVTTDPIAGAAVLEGVSGDHVNVTSTGAAPSTPSGACTLYYDGTSLWALGPSGTAVKLATT